MRKEDIKVGKVVVAAEVAVAAIVAGVAVKNRKK